MKIDKFDQLSEKLLNKLNEDYALYEENDGLVNTTNNGREKGPVETLQDMENKAAEEKNKAYEQDKLFNTEGTGLNHKTKVVREDEINLKKKKLKLVSAMRKTVDSSQNFNNINSSLDIITADELSDFDMHNLAEEFESDLEEENKEMLNSLNTLKDNEEAKIDKENDQYKETKSELTQNASDNKAQLGDQQAAEEEKMRQEKVEAEQKTVEEAQKKAEEHQQKVEQSEEKIEKINMAIDAAKNDDAPGGTKPMTNVNSEYNANVTAFKEEVERQQALEESFKQRRAEKKLEKAKKNALKAQDKENKVTAAQEKIAKKYDNTIDFTGNVDDIMAAYIGKPHEKRKLAKAKEKWDKLEAKRQLIHQYKTKPTDKKVIDAENTLAIINQKENLQSVNASLDFDELMASTDALLEDVNRFILDEEMNLEEETLLEAKSKKSKKKFNRAIDKDGKEIPGSIMLGDHAAYVPQDSKSGGSTPVEFNGMIAKIKKMISDEEAKEEPDVSKIKQLKQKLIEYENNGKK